MVRDPARIDKMLATLREAWLLSPDLRLGQLVVNVVQSEQPCPQIYYVEDDTMEAKLLSFVRRYGGQSRGQGSAP